MPNLWGWPGRLGGAFVGDAARGPLDYRVGVHQMIDRQRALQRIDDSVLGALNP